MQPFAKDDSRNPPPRTFLDRLARRYSRTAYVIVVLCVYVVLASALALALTPAVLWWQWVAGWSASLPPLENALGIAAGAASSFFMFGFALLIVVPIYNLVLPTKVRPFKGGYYTLRAAPWLLHNALFALTGKRLRTLPIEV